MIFFLSNAEKNIMEKHNIEGKKLRNYLVSYISQTNTSRSLDMQIG